LIEYIGQLCQFYLKASYEGRGLEFKFRASQILHSVSSDLPSLVPTHTVKVPLIALVYSTVKYATQVWCRSTLSKKIDAVLNDTMKIVTGCLHLTPIDFLPVLAVITLTSLRRKSTTHHLAQQAVLNIMIP